MLTKILLGKSKEEVQKSLENKSYNDIFDMCMGVNDLDSIEEYNELKILS